ncbi:MAG: hypothetical protein QG553_190 [Patescibacteria group bacterium]|nr:hypothetical protein [Patescibacteria group bacterium]
MPTACYRQLINATSELLGPASQRFIDRQIRNHLSIEPSDLTKADLKKLIQWLRLSVGVLTDDEALLYNYDLTLKKLCDEDKS